MTFREVLEAEIAKQTALIERMDHCPNPSFRTAGIMTTIRYERLELLRRLLELEPPGDGPTVTEPLKET